MTDPPRSDAVIRPATVVDTISRTVVWRDNLTPPTWPTVTVDAASGELVARAYTITADYRASTGPDGVTRWVVNVHVNLRVIGKAGRLVDDYRSRWFDDKTPAEEWPSWLRHAVDLYHPARGGPDQDPEGTYL